MLGCFVIRLLTIILTQNVGLSKQKPRFYISFSGLLYLPEAMMEGNGGHNRKRESDHALIIAFPFGKDIPII